MDYIGFEKRVNQLPPNEFEKFYNDANTELIANGKKYYECRFFYTSSSIKFLKPTSDKKALLQTLELLIAKTAIGKLFIADQQIAIGI